MPEVAPARDAVTVTVIRLPSAAAGSRYVRPGGALDRDAVGRPLVGVGRRGGFQSPVEAVSVCPTVGRPVTAGALVACRTGWVMVSALVSTTGCTFAKCDLTSRVAGPAGAEVRSTSAVRTVWSAETVLTVAEIGAPPFGVTRTVSPWYSDVPDRVITCVPPLVTVAGATAVTVNLLVPAEPGADEESVEGGVLAAALDHPDGVRGGRVQAVDGVQRLLDLPAGRRRADHDPWTRRRGTPRCRPGRSSSPRSR